MKCNFSSLQQLHNLSENDLFDLPMLLNHFYCSKPCFKKLALTLEQKSPNALKIKTNNGERKH